MIGQAKGKGMNRNQAGAALCALTLAALPGAAAAASQLTTQGTIWGNVNGDPIFVSEIDTPTDPLAAASVAETLITSGYAFEYFARSAFDTGVLELKTRATSDPGSAGSAAAVTGSGIPSAFARIEEELSFTPADDSPYTVTMSMLVTGGYVKDPSSDAFAKAELSLFPDAAAASVNEALLLPSANPVFETVQASVTLQGASTVLVYAQLASDIYSIGGGGAETLFAFDNSAYLSLSVSSPSVTVQSGSGRFLADAAVVPLPASLPLLAAGLSLLLARSGGGRRRSG